MYRLVYILLFVFALKNTNAQERRKLFPKSAVTGQYAGSTGLFTVGFSKVTRRDKLELGLLLGYLPKSFGGQNTSLSFKITYNPFQLHAGKKISIEPVQTGFFLCQNFNKDLGVTWGSKYPPGYYWWTRSLRVHVFLSTQVAYKIDKKHFDRIACYFEANTNDLYIVSYFPNRKALSFYDILFFGMGVKLYLK